MDTSTTKRQVHEIRDMHRLKSTNKCSKREEENEQIDLMMRRKMSACQTIEQSVIDNFQEKIGADGDIEENLSRNIMQVRSKALKSVMSALDDETDKVQVDF